jgi:hypothetical protein
MDTIETCSNIWALRQRPLPDWKPEPAMAQLTQEAEFRFALVKQSCDDFYHRRPSTCQKRGEAKMLEFLAFQERKWAQARTLRFSIPGCWRSVQ